MSAISPAGIGQIWVALRERGYLLDEINVGETGLTVWFLVGKAVPSSVYGRDVHAILQNLATVNYGPPFRL